MFPFLYIIHIYNGDLFLASTVVLLSKLVLKIMHVDRGSTDVVLQLFEALKIEPASLRFTIQESITSLAPAYKVCFLLCWLKAHTHKDNEEPFVLHQNI